MKDKVIIYFHESDLKPTSFKTKKDVPIWNLLLHDKEKVSVTLAESFIRQHENSFGEKYVIADKDFKFLLSVRKNGLFERETISAQDLKQFIQSKQEERFLTTRLTQDNYYMRFKNNGNGKIYHAFLLGFNQERCLVLEDKYVSYRFLDSEYHLKLEKNKSFNLFKINPSLKERTAENLKQILHSEFSVLKTLDLKQEVDQEEFKVNQIEVLPQENLNKVTSYWENHNKRAIHQPQYIHTDEIASPEMVKQAQQNMSLKRAMQQLSYLENNQIASKEEIAELKVLFEENPDKVMSYWEKHDRSFKQITNKEKIAELKSLLEENETLSHHQTLTEKETELADEKKGMSLS